MLPRLILMTLIKKDQEGKSHPSMFVSIVVLILALLMLGVEIMGSMPK